MSETSEAPTENILVIDVPERGRFEISVDGVPVGFTEYSDASAATGAADDLERTFPHTEIDPSYGGRGLAKILVRTALDSTRIKGYSVIPLCSVVRKFIAEHADYVDLVSVDRREEFGL